MKLNIPSKSDKEASTLRDAIRILAWESFKQEFKSEQLSGLELYEQKFNPEWKKHEVQKMNLNELKQFIESLGYTLTELINYRSEYYAKRDLVKQKVTETSTVIEHEVEGAF